MTTLDQKTVTALTLQGDDRDHIFRDDDLHGFGIRVRFDQKGRLCKTWCVQYRTAEGKQRRQNIGKFPRMNAATARTEAGAWLNRVHDGVDPAGEREAKGKAETLKFSKAVEQYLELKRLKVRDSTFKNTELYLTGRYFQPLHNKSLVKITQSDVASSNKPRERVLSEDEIRTVWNACEDDDLGRIIKLLLLTGCRADEIGGLRWSEIDLDQGTLTLPPERCKNGRTHTLSLSALALQILKQAKKRDGRDFLFGKWAGGFTSWAKQKGLIERLGIAHWTIHDLRRTTATSMAELGIEPHIVEAILNHVSGHKGGIAGIYNRASYAKQMKTALALWADKVDSIVNGNARKVVPLRA